MITESILGNRILPPILNAVLNAATRVLRYRFSHRFQSDLSTLYANGYRLNILKQKAGHQESLTLAVVLYSNYSWPDMHRFAWYEASMQGLNADTLAATVMPKQQHNAPPRISSRVQSQWREMVAVKKYISSYPIPNLTGRWAYRAGTSNRRAPQREPDNGLHQSRVALPRYFHGRNGNRAWPKLEKKAFGIRNCQRTW